LRQKLTTPIPNFFLIGVQKAGTTAIAEALSSHPEIFIADPKEPNFFVYSGGNPYGWEARGKDSIEWYLSLYRDARGQTALGDASPHYLCCDHCAGQIHQFNPDAKIVAVLRNPVYRAFSMYRYWYMNSLLPASADDFVDCFRHEKLRSPAGENHKLRVGYFGKHLQRYFAVFARDRIKVVFYHELVNHPRSFYRSIQAHLGVTPMTIDGMNRPVNVTVEHRLKILFYLLNRGYRGPIFDGLKTTNVGAALRRLRQGVNRANLKPRSKWLKFPSERYAELIAAYCDDIALLEDMLGVDLAGWRSGAML
jgi:hypothetical protein